MITGTAFVTIKIYDDDDFQEYPVKVRYEYEGSYVEDNVRHQGDSKMEIVQWMKHDPNQLTQETRLALLKELSNMWDDIVGDSDTSERDYDDYWEKADID